MSDTTTGRLESAVEAALSQLEVRSPNITDEVMRVYGLLANDVTDAEANPGTSQLCWGIHLSFWTGFLAGRALMEGDILATAFPEKKQD